MSHVPVGPALTSNVSSPVQKPPRVSIGSKPFPKLKSSQDYRDLCLQFLERPDPDSHGIRSSCDVCAIAKVAVSTLRSGAQASGGAGDPSTSLLGVPGRAAGKEVDVGIGKAGAKRRHRCILCRGGGQPGSAGCCSPSCSSIGASGAPMDAAADCRCKTSSRMYTRTATVSSCARCHQRADGEAGCTDLREQRCVKGTKKCVQFSRQSVAGPPCHPSCLLRPWGVPSNRDGSMLCALFTGPYIFDGGVRSSRRPSLIFCLRNAAAEVV